MAFFNNDRMKIENQYVLVTFSEPTPLLWHNFLFNFEQHLVECLVENSIEIQNVKLLSVHLMATNVKCGRIDFSFDTNVYGYLETYVNTLSYSNSFIKTFISYLV